MTTKERLYEYLRFKGISPSKVEFTLNWGKGSLIKPQSISLDRAEDFLLHFKDLSAEWLLRGTGSMMLNETSDSIKANDFDEAWYKKVIDDQHDTISLLKEKVKFLEKQIEEKRNVNYG